MSKLLDNMQPAIKEETKHVAIYTATGVVLMWLLFLVLHFTMPEKVPFNYTVILGGLGGGGVAGLDFLGGGLLGEKGGGKGGGPGAGETLGKGRAFQGMLFPMRGGVRAIVAPCFHYVAGILPLLFPGTGIKIMGILKK